MCLRVAFFLEIERIYRIVLVDIDKKPLLMLKDIKNRFSI